MQEIFVALLLFFNVETDQLVGVATAATETLSSCEALLAQVAEAQNDFETYMQGGCLSTKIYSFEE